MIEGLNRVQIDYACLGNHEFDLTIGVLQKRIHEFQVIAESKLSNYPTPVRPSLRYCL